MGPPDRGATQVKRSPKKAITAFKHSYLRRAPAIYCGNLPRCSTVNELALLRFAPLRGGTGSPASPGSSRVDPSFSIGLIRGALALEWMPTWLAQSK